MFQPMGIPTAGTTDKRFDTDFYVEGFATTFNAPYELYEFAGIKYYEMIARDALVGADMSDVIFQYNHAGKVLARMSNNTLGLEAVDHGLLTFADLSKSRAAKDMYEEIDNGLITKMSWAFTVKEDSYDRDTRHAHKFHRAGACFAHGVAQRCAAALGDNHAVSANAFCGADNRAEVVRIL